MLSANEGKVLAAARLKGKRLHSSVATARALKATLEEFGTTPKTTRVISTVSKKDTHETRDSSKGKAAPFMQQPWQEKGSPQRLEKGFTVKLAAVLVCWSFRWTKRGQGSQDKHIYI